VFGLPDPSRLDRWSRNVGNYQPTPHIIPEHRRPQLYCGESEVCPSISSSEGL